MISICIITYNHEKFIRKALQSVLMQEGVSMEVIVGDDCSTDNTFSVIKEFVDSNNLDWKILPNDRNVGMSKNWQRCIEAASGRYIALLEADDYWNDKHKLLKQVELLENDKTAVACFTNAHVKNEIDDKKYSAYVTDLAPVVTFADFIKGNNCPTCTVVFRRNKLTFHPAFHESPYVDWLLHLMNAQHGNYFFLNEKTSTYRLHGNGAYGGANEIARDAKLLKTMQCVAKIFGDRIHRKDIQLQIKQQHEKIAYKKLALGDRMSFISHKLKSKFI